jgi:hypothetical protein
VGCSLVIRGHAERNPPLGAETTTTEGEEMADPERDRNPDDKDQEDRNPSRPPGERGQGGQTRQRGQQGGGQQRKRQRGGQGTPGQQRGGPGERTTDDRGRDEEKEEEE